MVWSSSQTPLYQAVRAYNKRDCADLERPEKKHCEAHTKQERSKPQSSAREQSANHPDPRGIDRDMLLILMIVLILQSEKADNGLILALLITMIM